jgi:hypothetical protein
MINVKKGRIGKLCIIVRAGPTAGQRLTSGVDYDALAITRQHKLTVKACSDFISFFSSCTRKCFEPDV